MFRFEDIDSYHKQLINNQIDCVGAVQFYLGQIASGRDLNAFVEVYEEEALAKAVALDKSRKNGAPLKKLHGVVVAIKDVLCYKGHHVTAASGILKDFVSIYNATAIQHLLDEDAIIIGSCNCDEFAMGSTNEHSVYGKVLNPLDTSRVPGGSSGGSAVAVTAGMCMVSLGSDTGGSVRQPADFCGIIGIKPSYGRISRYGLIAYASSFDQIGIFGNSVADIALVLDILSTPDTADSTMKQVLPTTPLTKFTIPSDSKRYKLCYFKQALEHPSLDKEIATSIFTLIDSLRANGHVVKEIEFDLLDYIVPAYYVLTTAEASSNLSRYDGVRYGHRSAKLVEDLTGFYRKNRSEGFGMEVKRRIMLGTFVLSAGYYNAYYNKALQVRALLAERIAATFRDYDGIILPTSPCTAFKTGENDKDPIAMYLADIFTVFANLTGLPAISLPLFKHSNGMPFGLQVLTNSEDELTLLRLSDMLMNQYRQIPEQTNQ